MAILTARDHAAVVVDLLMTASARLEMYGRDVIDEVLQLTTALLAEEPNADPDDVMEQILGAAARWCEAELKRIEKEGR